MIGRLTGSLLHCAPDRILIDVTGVGYEVRIPLSTFYALQERAAGPTSLHVHTHVREDALQLYGFASLDERTLFEKLIAISGVGPRLALAILSGIGVEELRAAVVQRDWARLQKIPGVGKKTAERVLLELQDRLEVEQIAAGGADAAARTGGDLSSVETDAVSALVNLGYSRQVAGRAVARALDPTDVEPTLETVLRAALSGLVR